MQGVEYACLKQTLQAMVQRAGLTVLLQRTPMHGLDDGCRMAIKREDLRHTYLSGNKWHKLKYNLVAAHLYRRNGIVSFGGSYSNHIHALAAAGSYFEMDTFAIIRDTETETPMLRDAQAWGMQLVPVSRSLYRQRHTRSGVEQLLLEVAKRADRSGRGRTATLWTVPEGGSNRWALLGVAELAREIVEQSSTNPFDLWVVPCGTAVTLAGLVAGLHWMGLSDSIGVLGIAVLKGEKFLQRDIARHLVEWGVPDRGYALVHDYHHGGYAKHSAELREYKRSKTGSVDFDPVYTLKMAYAVDHLDRLGRFNENERILMIHTGGLQGLRT